MTRPTLESFPVVYRGLIEGVKAESLEEALNEDFLLLKNTFNKFSADQLNFAYAKDKWTLKQLLLHLIDTERIMSYRALRFARGDRTELSGFDENLYAMALSLNHRSKKSLIDELVLVRNCTKALYASMTDEESKREGIANGYLMSVRNIGFVMVGHFIHHLNVVKDRYMASPQFPA